MSVPDPLEEDLCGLALLNPGVFFDVHDQIAVEDFVHAHTQCIWRAIEATHERGHTITSSMVAANARDVPDDLNLSITLPVLMSNAAGTEPSIAREIAETLAERARKARVAATLEHLRNAADDPDATSDKLVSEAVVALVGAGGERADRFSGTLSTLMRQVVDRARDGVETGARRGIDIGIDEIERITGRWMPGDLIVLGAASQAGKTAVAMQVALNVAKQRPVLFFQLEMDGAALAERTIASMAGVSMTRIREGTLNAAEMEALEDAAALFGHKVDVRYKPRQTTAGMRAAALAKRGREGELGLIVVDHNKLVHVREKVRDRIERIAMVMDDLKALAKEVGAPVLLLAQMTREGRKRIEASGRFDNKTLRPNTYDIYGGGDMEEYADIILLMHRPEVILPLMEPPWEPEKRYSEWWDAMERWRGRGEFVAAKVRHGRAGGAAVMRWNGERTRYESLTEEQSG